MRRAITESAPRTKSRRLPDNKRIIDARGRLVLPGFNDAHVHLLAAPSKSSASTCAPRRTSRIWHGAWPRTPPVCRRAAGSSGGYWDHEAWPSKALPTRHASTRRRRDNPVFVQRLDGHMGVANCLAMKLAGVTRERPRRPDGGTIVRDATGEPTGVFKDNAMDLITRAVPPDTRRDHREGAGRAGSCGVARRDDDPGHDRERDRARAYQQLRATGGLTARIYPSRTVRSPGSKRRASGAASATTGCAWVV